MSQNIRRRDSLRTYEWLSRTEGCGWENASLSLSAVLMTYAVVR
jgi:hypothetical protein